MGDARALLASIGTSALLIIAVAASLLSISFVFAIGGFDGAQASGSRAAIVLDSQESSGSARGADAARAALVVDPATRVQRSRGSVRSAADSAGRVRTDDFSVRASSDTDRGPDNDSGSPDTSDGDSGAPGPPAPERRPTIGDSVKTIGGDVSATVKETGENLGEATAPLGPTVSAAVQQVLNVVAAIVQQATNLLGNVLGASSGK